MDIKLDSDDYILIARALYFYEDKLTNIEGTRRDNLEWDAIIYLRQRIGDAIKKAAIIN
jgi:hypothetical protein